MVVGMAEAGQSYDKPLHREEEGRPHQDALAEIDLWGISPCRWYDGFDGQDTTKAGWTFPGGCGSVFGPCGTCGTLQEAQRGQRFAPWMLIMPKKDQRLPQRGLTSPNLALL
jgi:hypothetical protein